MKALRVKAFHERATKPRESNFLSAFLLSRCFRSVVYDRLIATVDCCQCEKLSEDNVLLKFSVVQGNFVETILNLNLCKNFIKI